MDRRKFLVGVGSASIGGSALIGSGAFSRVEAQRAVSIQVAEDPDAYLGLDKCRYPDYEGEYVPNGSYAHLDENGHLAIQMNEANPHHPDDDLGAGVNSNSRTWFDRVFQICNQGKQTVCVWIDDKEGDYAERVSFYLEDDSDDSLETAENGVTLDVGDCVCVGLKTDTRDTDEFDTDMPSASEQLLEEVTLYAVAGEECPPPEEPVPPEEEPNGDDEVELFDAATISFLAFCAEESVSGATVDAIEWEDDDGERGDPVTVKWNTDGTDINEIVLWTGQNTGFFFFPNGDDEGIVTTRQDDDVPDNYTTADRIVDDGDTSRSQREPCEDGDTSTKFEWGDDEFVEELD